MNGYTRSATLVDWCVGDADGPGCALASGPCAASTGRPESPESQVPAQRQSSAPCPSSRPAPRIPRREDRRSRETYCSRWAFSLSRMRPHAARHAHMRSARGLISHAAPGIDSPRRRRWGTWRTMAPARVSRTRAPSRSRAGCAPREHGAPRGFGASRCSR